MIILKPEQVAVLMDCTTRRAFDYMRQAGAIPCGKDSLRITEERFSEWRGVHFQPPKPFAERLLPRSLWLVPRLGRYLRPGWNRVYFISSDDAHVKIGYTGDIDQRLNSLQLATPSKLRVLAMMEGAVSVERELHEAFAAQRIHGEWFRREGALAELLKKAPQ